MAKAQAGKNSRVVTTCKTFAKRWFLVPKMSRFIFFGPFPRPLSRLF